MKRVEIAKECEKDIMKKYLDEYLSELSKFDDNIKFDDNGTPIYKWFDFYWNDAGRYPFFFYVDDQIAGICFVRKLSEHAYEIAEFYVTKSFRGKGNAMWFAGEIANKFDGEILFSTRQKNLRAVAFWTKFANTFERCEFSKDDEWENWTIGRKESATHHMSLNRDYFEKIASGKKTLEGRLNDEKRQAISVGDFVIFENKDNKNQTTKVKILDKYYFDNFDQMLLFVDKNALGFDKNTEDNDILNAYRSIYSKDKEEKYGVVIFKIERV